MMDIEFMNSLVRRRDSLYPRVNSLGVITRVLQPCINLSPLMATQNIRRKKPKFGNTGVDVENADQRTFHIL